MRFVWVNYVTTPSDLKNITLVLSYSLCGCWLDILDNLFTAGEDAKQCSSERASTLRCRTFEGRFPL